MVDTCARLPALKIKGEQARWRRRGRWERRLEILKVQSIQYINLKNPSLKNFYVHFVNHAPVSRASPTWNLLRSLDEGAEQSMSSKCVMIRLLVFPADLDSYEVSQDTGVSAIVCILHMEREKVILLDSIISMHFLRLYGCVSVLV